MYAMDRKKALTTFPLVLYKNAAPLRERFYSVVAHSPSLHGEGVFALKRIESKINIGSFLLNLLYFYQVMLT